MENQEVICSRQNRTVVEMVKLADRGNREEAKCFRFDGIKLLEEALKNHVELQVVLLKESCKQKILEKCQKEWKVDLKDAAERILTVENDLFDRISEEKSPEGVICSAKYLDKSKKIATIYKGDDFSVSFDEWIVLAESVRDPSNVGAIIRSAAAMGVDRLILSKDCADVYHPKTVRASMGTLFNQKIDLAEDLPGVIQSLQQSGRRVFAAALDPNASLLGSFEIQKGDCVVIGNEGHGLGQEVLRACGHRVIIPMSRRAESLNASVAASILMWEFGKKNAR